MSWRGMSSSRAVMEDLILQSLVAKDAVGTLHDVNLHLSRYVVTIVVKTWSAPRKCPWVCISVSSPSELFRIVSPSWPFDPSSSSGFGLVATRPLFSRCPRRSSRQAHLPIASGAVRLT